jgi:hypothetical protein
MARSMMLLAAVLGMASAFQAPPSKLSMSAPAVAPASLAPRVAALRMAEEPDAKAVAIGAAAVGGILGVYLFHELSNAVFLAVVLAYGTTVSNKFGNASKSAGEFAAKAYGKTTEINNEYDVLGKAKSVADTVCTAAANLDSNYGISSGIDEKLKLSEAVDKVGDKVNDLKSSVTGKVDDLKSKASSS